MQSNQSNIPVRGLTLLVAVALFLQASPLFAATPDLQVILPQGVQRGTETDLDLRGARLGDAQELFFFSPGITVSSLKVVNPQQVTAHVKVEKDAAVGEINVRLRSASGISELRTIYVGPFPIINSDNKTNVDFDHPQTIGMNQSVWGIIANEQAQYFSIEAKKGQRLTAEVHGARLGHVFDPYVAILDEKRFELAVSDDTALAMQDPIVSIIAPRDGKYIILLRDSAYGGGAQAHFLLHVGTFSRPRTIFPLGGQAGSDLSVKFIGDIAGPFERTLTLSAGDVSRSRVEILPEQEGLFSPSPNFIRVSSFPNVLEAEPNNDLQHANVAPADVPFALNGIISEAGDVDYFKFKAKKGQAIDIRVYARALRSPLDSVITIYNDKGGAIANNDDSGSPDSYLRFNPPADSEYGLSITDQLHEGGPEYTYRVEFTLPKPALALAIPQYNANSQERWTVPVPRGNRYATLVRATRTDIGGDVAISAANLPEGITMIAPDVAGATDVTPVVFEAAVDAPIAGRLSELRAKPADPKVDLAGSYRQDVELAYGQNNSVLYKTRLERLSVSVTVAAPFRLHLEQPKGPIVQNGTMNLKVAIDRDAGFAKPLSLRFLFSPPGIGAAATLDVPADKNEAFYPINANGNAAPRKWKVCVVGTADVTGQLWVSSELVDIEIAQPYLGGKIQLTAAEQGKPSQVLCKLEQRTPFDGPAKVELLGLPVGVTAEPLQITAADQQVMFPITVGEKSPLGQKPGLYCRVTVMKDGAEIIHNIAQGGVLRIDPQTVPKKGAPVQTAAAKPKPGEVAKPLSRLEKLRQEQSAEK